MRTVASLLVLAAALAAPAYADGGAPQRPVEGRAAVFPLTTSGVAPEQVALLDAALSGEVRRLPSLDVQASDDTRLHLTGAQSVGVSCDRREAACLAQLGALCGVDWVITGVVEGAAEGQRVSLLLIDVGQSRRVRQVQGRIPPTTTDYVASFRALLEDMFRDPATLGAIELVTAEVGAEVLLDGERVGTTPLAGPLARLVPGPHAVEVRTASRAVEVQTVKVEPGKVTRVEVFMGEGGGVADNAALWVGTGGAVAGAGALALLVGAGIAAGTQDLAYAPLGKDETIDGRVASIRTAQASVYTLYVVGGAAVVAGLCVASVPLFAE